MQLLCSCHIAALSGRGSLCSLCTFPLGNWRTQWDLGDTSVLATTVLHWTFSSMSRPSCSGGLTNPTGKGRVASLGLLAVLSPTQLRMDTLGFVSRACCWLKLYLLLVKTTKFHIILFFHILSLFNYSHTLSCIPYFQHLLFLHRIPYWALQYPQCTFIIMFLPASSHKCAWATLWK